MSPRLVSVSSSTASRSAVPQSPGVGRPAAPTRTGEHLRLVPTVAAAQERRLGRRLSPVLLLSVATVIVALFGLAAFHNLMASAQYDLERIERELELEQARLVDLEFQVEQANSPATVETLARGVLGMEDPTGAVDLVIDTTLLAHVNSATVEASPVGTSDWSDLRPLLGAS